MNMRKRAQFSWRVTVAGLGMFAVCLALAPSQLQAANRTKAGTGTDLTAAASWDALPGSSDTATWVGSSRGAGLAMPGSLSWYGISVAGALGDIDITGTGSLTVGTGGIDLSASTVNMSLGNPIILGSSQTWSVTNSRTLAVGGNVSGAAGLTKAGAGTLTLSGSNGAWTGSTAVNAGTLNLNGGFGGTIGTGASSVFGVGYANGTAGAVLNIGGGTFNAHELKVGYTLSTTAGTGWLTMTGGTITMASATWFVIGGEDTQPGNGTLGAGQVDMSGNSVINMNYGQTTPCILIGVRGGMGVLNISGTAALNANTIYLGNTYTLAGEDAKIRAYLTQSGGTVTLSDAANGLQYQQTANSAGVYNLNGGVLNTKVIKSGGNVTANNEIFNFNGGTLKAGAASGAFMGGLSGAIIYTNGATIDDGGYVVTISQVLSSPAGYGLGAVGTTLTPTAAGSGYVNPPNVTFNTPSGGLPATGYATINAAGQVTGIVITSPGSGYTSGQAVTVTLAGGGGGSGATFTSVTASTTNICGVLTKTNSGTLTLSGANTYSGGTVVSAGTLQVDGSSGAINSSSGITVNGAGAKYLHTATTASTRTITQTLGTVDGTGTLGTVNVASNSANVVQNGNGGTSTLTIGTLTFSGAATVNIAQSGTPSTPGVNVTGMLSTTPANGTVTINATITGGGWTSGTDYSLINVGSKNFSLNDFTLGTVTGVRQGATLALNGNNLVLHIGTVDNPKWTGRDSTNWVVGTTGANKNWKLITADTATDYLQGDAVLFDDSASSAVTPGLVVISAANVSPTSTIFSNSSISTYTVSGSYGIAGVGSLTKSGSGTLTLTTTNTYTGTTTVNAGTLQLGDGAAGHDGSLVSGISDNAALVYNLNGIQTASYNVSGSGSLTKAGAGTLLLYGANTYTGGTILNAGTVYITNDFNLGAAGSAMTFANNATLRTTNTIILANRAVTLNTGGGTFNVDPVSTLTITNLVTGAGGLTKSGTGTLMLVGTNTYTGATTVSAGLLKLNGSGTVGASGFDLSTAGASGQAAALNLASGGVTCASVLIGRNGGGGYMAMSGGTITNSAYFTTSVDGGIGQFDMSGGTVSQTNTSNDAEFGTRGSKAIVNFRGSAQFTAAGGINLGFVNNTQWSTGVVSQSGSALITSGNAVGLQFFGGSVSSISGFCAYNLNGGTLSVKTVQQKGAGNGYNGYLNFNGGTLQAYGASGNTYGTFINNMSGVYIYTNGATIDTQGNTVTIGQSLLAPGGNTGVTGVSFSTNTTANYVVPPNVSFSSPVGGVAATGYATINPVSGQVTGIVITSPGFGYSGDPTIALTGGGGSGLLSNIFTRAASASGGLTKLGTGSLTLSGTNTYAGVTAVSNGVLRLTHNQVLSAATDVYIAAGAGAKVKLDFSGTNTIHRLYVDGVLQQKNKPVGIIQLPTALDGSGYFLPTDGAPRKGTMIRII